MSVHSRRSSGTVLDSLERTPAAGSAILHWFSGSFRDLERADNLGCWFSVGPAMLASEKGRALAARMPCDRVLTESDGPFAKLDGSPVNPWQVENAVQALGEIWSMSPEKVDQTINDNLRRLLSTHADLWSFSPP